MIFLNTAVRFYNEFSHSLRTRHNQVIHHLSTLLLPSHVQNDELAQRFRNEKYQIRMSRSGFSLLVGWLTEGVGGEGTGSGDGFSGEPGKRGRAAVMRVVNNHLKFDGKAYIRLLNSTLVFTFSAVTTSSTASMSANAWEESTGVLAPLLPPAGFKDAQSFNASKGELKLGPAPLSEELQTETERALKEQAMVDPNSQYDLQYARPVPLQGVVPPSLSDLPPHPPTFKIVDVKREVEKVRDARNRIRLEPSMLNNVNVNTPQGAALRSRALPSICAYTLHDVGEG